MTKTRKAVVQFKPPCYYCDRRFVSERSLIFHQRAKHFNCRICKRKLDTARGWAVHLLQVHKQNFNKVQNALEERSDISLLIRGIQGVPDDYIQRLVQQDALEQKPKRERYDKHVKLASDYICIDNNELYIANLDKNSELYKKVLTKLGQLIKQSSSSPGITLSPINSATNFVNPLHTMGLTLNSEPIVLSEELSSNLNILEMSKIKKIFNLSEYTKKEHENPDVKLVWSYNRVSFLIGPPIHV